MRAANFAQLEAAVDAQPPLDEGSGLPLVGAPAASFQTVGGTNGPGPSLTRERSVVSLCGQRKVWTDDRSCGCRACEVLR